MTEAVDALAAADGLRNAEIVAADASVLAEQVLRLWDKGLPPGDRTGWRSVDRHYTVAPGQFTVVTGWPGSGKSEWLDALTMNLAMQGWRFAIFSPENYPPEVHVSKMLEKFVIKPFGSGPTERMTKDEVSEAITEIEKWFGFLVPSSDTERTNFGIEEILKAAETHFRMSGHWRSKENPCGLVIDPWNELEHLRPKHWSETEYVSATLSRVRSWARMYNVHVWIVAHPQKMRREDGKLPIPRPDMIAGSQHWWNKADNAVTVWRDFENLGSQDVDIYIQKIRFKHIGRPGLVQLRYDRVTGRYMEPPAKDFAVVAG